MTSTAKITDMFNTLRNVAYQQLSDAEQLGQFMVDALIDSGGHFILSATGADLFYLDRESGLLMPVDGSDQIRRLLKRHGVVSSKKIIGVLCDFARPVAEIADVHRLGWYDQATNTVYVYSQGQEVFKVTATGIETVANGCDGIYFLHEPDAISFRQTDANAAKGAFKDLMQEVVTPAPGLFPPDHALYLLVLWFCCIFLSPLVTTMPALLLIGEAGSGKTRLMRLFSQLLSGNELAIARFQKEWGPRDKAISTQGFVAIDNITEWDEWLDKRLESITNRESITVKAGKNSCRTVPVDCRLALSARQLIGNSLPAFNLMLPIELTINRNRVLGSRLRQKVSTDRDVLMTSVLHLLQSIVVALDDSYGPDYAGPCLLGDFANIAIRLARFNNPVKGNGIAACFERIATAATKATKTADDNLLLALKSWVAEHSGESVTPPDLLAELEKIASNSGYRLEVSGRFGHYLNKMASRFGHLFQIDKRKSRGRYQEYTFWMRPQ